MKTQRFLRILTTLIILAVFAVYFFTNSAKFRPLLSVEPVPLLIIALADIAIIFVNGLFTKFILQPFKKHIPLLESFYVSLISTVGNFFAPVGAGFGFRAVYLKRKFNLPYSQYISTLSGNYIIVFLVNSFFGLLSLFLLRARHDSQYGVLVAVFGGIFMVSLTLSLIQIPFRTAEGVRYKFLRSLVRNLVRVTEGWNYIVSRRRLMARLVGLTIINLLLTMLITWLIIHALHFNIALAPLVLFSVLGSLSLFINITPANLGVKEAIYLFSSHVLGFSVSQILSIALIDRGVMFVILLLLWLGSHKMQTEAAAASTPAQGV